MLQFVREIPIRIVLQGALSSRRGFLFHLAAGFRPAGDYVDPLSGMSVNLVTVDQWLAELKAEMESTSWNYDGGTLPPALAEVLVRARQILSAKAASTGVSLASLKFREERGWNFQWAVSQPEQLKFTYSHYLEFLPQHEEFRLLRLDLTWSRVSSCDSDFQHEGFKLLKTVQTSRFEDLLQMLSGFQGQRLESGSFLKSVEVFDLASDFSLML